VESIGCSPKKETNIIRDAGKVWEAYSSKMTLLGISNEEKEAEPSPNKVVPDRCNLR
jgi:hypothetical protein